jgi:hypothetical protein
MKTMLGGEAALTALEMATSAASRYLVFMRRVRSRE